MPIDRVLEREGDGIPREKALPPFSPTRQYTQPTRQYTRAGRENLRYWRAGANHSGNDIDLLRRRIYADW